MDFANLEMTKEPVFVQLLHPKTGAPLFSKMPDPENPDREIDDIHSPIGAVIHSGDSEQFKKTRRATADKLIERRMKGPNAPITNTLEIESSQKAAFLSCLVELRGIVYQSRLLSVAKDASFFYDHFPWAVEQLDIAMADRSRFMKG